MRRAVVTGLGVVSPLGNDTSAVLDALRNGRSGIRYQQTYADMGLRSLVAGNIELDLDELIDRKLLRFHKSPRPVIFQSRWQQMPSP